MNLPESHNKTRSTTHGRNDRNYRFRTQWSGESAAVSNILIADEDVDVRPNRTLLG